MRTNLKLTELLKGQVIKEIHQQECNLQIDFDDGAHLEIRLAEETSSVLLRNSQDGLDYAD